VNPVLGWTLAALALAAGWAGWGWQGLVLAATVIAFWLVLQFNRALRVLRGASGRPVGHVESAVMLNAKLQRGWALWQVIALTRSLGERTGDGEDRWRWTDPSGASVELTLRRGRVAEWRLQRPGG